MTEDAFLIAVYEFAASLVNSLTTLVQDLGPYAGPALEAIADLLLAADITLHYVQEGVCFFAG